jgi:DNA-binding NarL/FixJ family response regulator
MAPKRKRRKPAGDPVANELADIKRLLILQLLTSGVQTKEIASSLGVDNSTISRMVPARKVKKRPSGW